MRYLLFLLVVIGVVMFRLWQRREKTIPASQVTDGKASNKYHCVAITDPGHSCAAAQRLEGKRFLSAEAPIFPLTGCTADPCQCRYIHHDDRREEERRYLYGRYGSIPPTLVGEERRHISGRRDTDETELDETNMPDFV